MGIPNPASGLSHTCIPVVVHEASGAYDGVRHPSIVEGEKKNANLLVIYIQRVRSL